MTSALSGDHLLIVDDDEGPRQSLDLIFRDQYKVTTASSGEEAVALSKKEPFAIAIVDIRMAGLSGIEVLKELKEIFPFTEVIILTAYESLDSARQAIANGASEYLSKPFEIDHIQEVVKKCQNRFNFITKQDRIIQDEIDEVKNAFINLLSHELKTPLNGIVGFTDLLDDGNLNKDQSEYINVIRKCSYQLLDILNDILEYAKLAANKHIVTSELFNPATLLLHAINKIDNENPKLSINVDIPIDLPPLVQGPEYEVKTILNKLIDNAVKFTPSGEVNVALKQEIQRPNEILLTFSVTDNGVGIPQEIIDSSQLFKPFSQVDDTPTRTYGGLGLGLALCKNLCSHIDAKIEVESKPGEGSRFLFAVPVKEVSLA